MIVALVAVVVVALAALLAMFRLQERQAAHVSELLARQDHERYAWTKERWELNTRIQAPEIARVHPPAPPTLADPAGAENEDEDEDEDESHLIGLVA